MQSLNGQVWTNAVFRNVKYVPDINFNLFSEGVLDSRYSIQTKGDKKTFFKNGQLLIIAKKNTSNFRNLVELQISFPQNLKQNESKISTAFLSSDSILLQYERFGHFD